MKAITILALAVAMLVSTSADAQTRKPKTKKKPTVVNSGEANAKPEVSLKGHVDLILTGNGGQIPIDKSKKGDYLFEVYTDPSDRTAPRRKTAFLKLDVDWKALGGEEDQDVCWSWSGKDVLAVKQEKGYALMSGTSNVLNIGFVDTKDGKKTFIQLNQNGMSGLAPGMHLDDLARYIQSEVPGTRVVETGNKKNGLSEYVLLSFGENKVYDVTGDYHYELNNREPYFTFWVDAKKKLVIWFAQKKVR